MEDKVERYHDSVMLNECLAALNLKEGGIYVDVTFGGGGHSSAILKSLVNVKLIAFDQDKSALRNSIDDNRFILINDNFRNITQRLAEIGITKLDGLLGDFGVSSHQFDVAERGFSTRFDAVLDMRMNQDTEMKATTVLNKYAVSELTEIFKAYGELTNAYKVATTIVQHRQVATIETVDQLKSVVARHAYRGKEHTFYAQLFQSLRIEVNDEMGALHSLLNQLPNLIDKGGRIALMSYHSLEDRPVKNLINTGNIEGNLNKDFYGNKIGISFKAINKKPQEPTKEEIDRNPRSRSAKLRIAERI